MAGTSAAMTKKGIIFNWSQMALKILAAFSFRLSVLSGGEHCEPRGDMQTSAANTKIAHENKACALREKP
jgi:hypothetical protein